MTINELSQILLTLLNIRIDSIYIFLFFSLPFAMYGQDDLVGVQQWSQWICWHCGVGVGKGAVNVGSKNSGGRESTLHSIGIWCTCIKFNHFHNSGVSLRDTFTYSYIKKCLSHRQITPKLEYTYLLDFIYLKIK